MAQFDPRFDAIGYRDEFARDSFLQLGSTQKRGFAVRKNVEIKSVQVFDLDV